MSHHTWNFSHQKQEQQVVEKEEEENRYTRGHVHNQQNQVDPMYVLIILATSNIFLQHLFLSTNLISKNSGPISVKLQS